MRKSIVALGAIGLTALSVAPALAGNSTGGGAQKASLYRRPADTSCSAQPGGTAAGWVILNSTGQPGNSKSVLGEVSVKTEPNQQYAVLLVNGDGGNNCQNTKAVGTLTTNAQGNGNAHISQVVPSAVGTANTWHVVLHNMNTSNNDLASPTVTLD